MVGPETAASLASKESTPLYPEHRYVAQRYVWPPVLFGGRKCHVRVYGLLASDGRAFVHHRAFLHVANDPFTTRDATVTGSFSDSIHISNCCANSHDATKFAGEILADFEETEYSERDGRTVVPLAAFFPSVRSCLSFLAQQAFPFVQGGQANNGFEYLGIDFMLSYNHNKDPLAYILEINAPPSQDSATGLPHAENLHNEVIQDLITLWVLPHITQAPVKPGGWRCVYTSPESSTSGEPIIPSKAAIINKIRWSMFEKKAQRMEKEDSEKYEMTPKATENGTEDNPQQRSSCNLVQGSQVAKFARLHFPFFSDATLHRTVPQVFFENAGGSQVAQQVINAVSESLQYRHRSIIGTKTKLMAQQCVGRLLGATEDDIVVLGPNATTLIATLADKYVRCGLMGNDDEVILSTENHSANFDPWIEAAKDSGATVKLWTPFDKRRRHERNGILCSSALGDLVNSRTRVVALPHASNVLGQVRDLSSLSRMVKMQSNGHAHVVVDGVAAVPHVYAGLEDLNVDWYVISCHKIFGPHLGALCGRRRGAIESFVSPTGLAPCGDDDTALYTLLESGTINYEGCAGVVGLGEYFASLGNFAPQPAASKDPATISSTEHSCESGEACIEAQASAGFLQRPAISKELVQEAYQRIRHSESPLVTALLRGLTRSKNIRILEGDGSSCSNPPLSCLVRLPTVSFVHAKISPNTIVSFLGSRGISCRCSSFLCTPYLADDLGFDHAQGVVRVSLAHYNTLTEVDLLLRALSSMTDW